MSSKPSDDAPSGALDGGRCRDAGRSLSTSSRAETRLIRRWSFTASHHYPVSRLVARDAASLALCEPHEHTWTVEVRVVGHPDPESGFLVDLDQLDRAWRALVSPSDGGSLNDLLPAGTSPSTEEVARWLFHSLRAPVEDASCGQSARLESVVVFEDRALGAEYPAVPEFNIARIHGVHE